MGEIACTLRTYKKDQVRIDGFGNYDYELTNLKRGEIFRDAEELRGFIYDQK